jgi:ABC-type multidrug transport system fused ATPase/permease subunit
VQLRNREATFGVNLVNSVNLKIYQKALRYPIISSRQFTEADIINYSQIDADSLNLIASKFIFFIYGVIEIIAGVGILYAFIGYVSFISLGLMVLVNAISFKIGTATIAYNMKGLETKDERINATDEMLNIIKHIKINASEKHFFKKINRIREVELQTYKDKGLL